MFCVTNNWEFKIASLKNSTINYASIQDETIRLRVPRILQLQLSCSDREKQRCHWPSKKAPRRSITRSWASWDRPDAVSEACPLVRCSSRMTRQKRYASGRTLLRSFHPALGVYWSREEHIYINEYRKPDAHPRRLSRNAEDASADTSIILVLCKTKIDFVVNAINHSSWRWRNTGCSYTDLYTPL